MVHPAPIRKMTLRKNTANMQIAGIRIFQRSGLVSGIERSIWVKVPVSAISVQNPRRIETAKHTQDTFNGRGGAMSAFFGVNFSAKVTVNASSPDETVISWAVRVPAALRLSIPAAMTGLQQNGQRGHSRSSAGRRVCSPIESGCVSRYLGMRNRVLV